MRKLTVPQKWNEKKLNTFLLDSIEGLSLNLLYKALRKKDIRINGKRTNANETIYTSDVIEVYIADNVLEKDFPITMVYEDDNILIVNKPVSMEVTGENSLEMILQKQYHSSIFACHRLDRNTTGLILFAKHEEAKQILFAKFKNQEIEKHYVCHVYGVPPKTSSTETAYLFKDAKKSQVYILDTPKKGYQEIITSYSIIKTFDDTTCLLDVNLHTGKTHQIRAHLAHLGYPIIGDGKYGINEINKKYKVSKQQLCSYSLTFNFTTPSGILDYLSGKNFKIDCPF